MPLREHRSRARRTTAAPSAAGWKHTPGSRHARGLSIRPPRGLPGTGFTLIEILVVVAIIAVMATLATLSIGSRSLDDRLDIEARRLQALIALAADDAVLQGRELGFLQTPNGYTFLTLKDGHWQPLEDAGPLRAREVSEPFYLELQVEGRTVKPKREGDDREEVKPQVLLLSSGDATEFVLDVRALDYAPHYRLQGDVLGRLKLERKAS